MFRLCEVRFLLARIQCIFTVVPTDLTSAPFESAGTILVYQDLLAFTHPCAPGSYRMDSLDLRPWAAREFPVRPHDGSFFLESAFLYRNKQRRGGSTNVKPVEMWVSPRDGSVSLRKGTRGVDERCR